MSDLNEQLQQAVNLVNTEVIAPVFMAKLASHGITLETPEQIARAWGIGEHILQLEAQQKTANDLTFDGALKTAEERLYSLTAKLGFQQQVAQDVIAQEAAAVLADDAIKQACLRVMQAQAAA